MNTDEPALGPRPNCEDRIPEAWLLVEYTKDDGPDGIWAECPGVKMLLLPSDVVLRSVERICVWTAESSGHGRESRVGHH
jgi:hypothetical protein